MTRMLRTSISVGMAVSYRLLLVAAAAEPTDPISHGGPELALHYDFAVLEVGRASDTSGNGHDSDIFAGHIVEGRYKNAVQFDGKGAVRMAGAPGTISPKDRPLTAGASCMPMALDGVLVAMGDEINGFSLYLKEGVPQFVVRANGQLFRVAARDPVPAEQWVHLAGALDSAGTLWLVVNGWPCASAPGQLIPGTPSEPFSVGADEGSPVGEYAAPLCWTGLVQDVRLYWGYLDRSETGDAWQDWANLPGCGCRK